MNTSKITEHVDTAIHGAGHPGVVRTVSNLEIESYIKSLLPALRKEVSLENTRNDYYHEGSRFHDDKRVVQSVLQSIPQAQDALNDHRMIQLMLPILIPQIVKGALVGLAETDYHYTFEKEW